MTRYLHLRQIPGIQSVERVVDVTHDKIEWVDAPAVATALNIIDAKRIQQKLREY
jgi:hypothetical protein